MIKITLVFYQYPEAISEILDWELKQQKIFKKDLGKGRINYTLVDKDEILFCFDIKNFKIEEIETLIDCSSYLYNKTLIFGKINHFQLEKIQQLLLKFE